MSNGYYPIMIKLSNERAVIIGGGKIAARKAQGLLASGVGLLTLVAPTLCEELQQLVDEKKVIWKQQHYQAADLEYAALVFAATDDAKLNEQISNDARDCDILVCNVSDGDKGSFITPAVVRSGGLTATISSAGSSPGLVKHIKQQLKMSFLPRYEQIGRVMERLRADIMHSSLNPEQRQRMLRMALTDVLAASNEDVLVQSAHNKKSDQVGSILSNEENYQEWYVQLYNRTIQGEGEETVK